MVPLPRGGSIRGLATANSSGSGSSLSSFTASGSSIDYELFETQPCRLGGVAEQMRRADRGLLTCKPEETLNDVIPRLSKVSGLPVLNESGLVVGVLSRRDIIRVRKDPKKGTLNDKVSEHMTAPAVTINVGASVEEAAALMLSKKIRRLPVVDDQGLPVGILAKSDIFRPLFEEQYMNYNDREVAQLNGDVKRKMKKISWTIKYLYDGDCAMCLSLKTVLERQDKGRGAIKFVNIADPNYNPQTNMGIQYDDAMETIHGIKPDGQVLYGVDALNAMFDAVGLGWATKLAEAPLFSGVVDGLYGFLSSNRMAIGGAMDAVIAAKRVQMSKQGQETCGDMDEECAVEW